MDFLVYSVITAALVIGNFAENRAGEADSTLPTIVWWTGLLYPHLETTLTIACPKSKCLSTRKKVIKNNETTAYMFYGTDFDPENLPLPRKACDVWALLHEESPMNNFIFSHSAGIQLFNYTATFSRYSDYPLTTQFVPSLNYLTDRKQLPTKEKNVLRAKGFAPVIYVQSHCNPASDRDRYVKELMKYVDIDSYGRCLHNRDLPDGLDTTEAHDSEDFLNFIAQYKFVIAFENALCDDYITEKLFRALHVGVVPVYKGSPSIRDWAPSQESIIVADDFESPEVLATYIRTLDENDELYENYLTYKTAISNEHLIKVVSEREWGVNDRNRVDFITGFECFLCDSINTRTCSDVKIAHKKHMNCHEPHPSLDVGVLPLTDEWLKEDWSEAYWFALDQAKAIQRMIRENENNSRHFMQHLMEFKYKS